MAAQGRDSSDAGHGSGRGHVRQLHWLLCQCQGGPGEFWLFVDETPQGQHCTQTYWRPDSCTINGRAHSHSGNCLVSIHATIDAKIQTPSKSSTSFSSFARPTPVTTLKPQHPTLKVFEPIAAPLAFADPITGHRSLKNKRECEGRVVLMQRGAGATFATKIM